MIGDRTSFFLIKSRVIEWRNNKSELINQVALTSDALGNLEVHNEQKLIDLIKVLISHKKVGTIDLYLDDSVVFAKKFAISATLMSDIEELWDEIPVLPDLMAKKVLISTNGAIALATNRAIYQSVVKGIEQLGGEVGLVVAEAAVAFLPKIDIKRLDFSEDDVLDLRPHMRKSYVKILTVILVLSIFGTGFYSGWKYRVWDRSGADNLATNAISSTPRPLTEASPTLQVRNLQVSFKVLNATETTGLAGQVKDILTSDGYTKVETGNLNAVTASASSVLMTEKVSQFDREQLVQLLEKKLGILTVEDATGSAEFDVVVTINKAF